MCACYLLCTRREREKGYAQDANHNRLLFWFCFFYLGFNPRISAPYMVCTTDRPCMHALHREQSTVCWVCKQLETSPVSNCAWNSGNSVLTRSLNLVLSFTAPSVCIVEAYAPLVLGDWGFILHGLIDVKWLLSVRGRMREKDKKRKGILCRFDSAELYTKERPGFLPSSKSSIELAYI